MHRKHIRATVDGTDVDIPISTFGALQFLFYNGEHITTAELPENLVSGVPPTLDNAIVRWNGTSGTSIQNSLVLISDLAQVTGVTALNGRDIARWTDGPSGGGSTDNAIARWDSTTGRLLQDSSVAIDDSGNITGVTSINGVTWTGDYVRGPTPAVSADNNIATWDGLSGRLIQDSGLNIFNVVYFLEAEAVTGHLPEFADSTGRRIIDSGIISDHVVQSPGTSTDNAVARYDSTTGKFIQDSVVIISDSGVITGVNTINGFNPSQWVRSSTSSVANFEIVLWQGTDGRAVTGSGILWNQVAYIGAAFGNDNRLVRTDTATNNRAIQPSGITIDDSNNMTGVTSLNGLTVNRIITYTVAAGGPVVNEIACFDNSTLPYTVSYRPVQISSAGTITGVADLTMSGSLTVGANLNGRDPDTFVAGPAGATDNRVARYDGATGYLIQNSAVTIDDSGNISGVGTLNSIVLANLVSAAAVFATDNRVLRSDGTARGAQASAVTIDDSGNISGAGTYNGLDITAHAARHQPGGADAIFTGSSSDWAQMIPEWRSSGGGSWLRRLMRAYLTQGGSSSGSYVSVMTNTTVALTSGNVGCAVAFIPYSLSDTGLNVTVFSSWNNATTNAHVSCGNSGGRIASSGGTVVFGSTTPNGIPAVGIITVVWPVAATGTAQVGLAVAISGSGGTVHPGIFMSFSGEATNA